MTLFIRELKELQVVLVGAVVTLIILALGLPFILQNITISWSAIMTPFINLILFVFTAYLAANAITGDRERGTERFILALPLSRQEIWLQKTGCAAFISFILWIGFAAVSPGLQGFQYYALFLLSFALGSLFAHVHERSINAAASSFAIILILYGFHRDILYHSGLANSGLNSTDHGEIVLNIIMVIVASISIFASYYLTEKHIDVKKIDL